MEHTTEKKIVISSATFFFLANGLKKWEPFQRPDKTGVFGRYLKLEAINCQCGCNFQKE